VGLEAYPTLVAAAHEDVAEAAKGVEDGTFVFAAAGAGVGEDAAGEARKWQRLQPHFPGAGEGGEEEAFAAEEGIFDAADETDVVVDAGLEGDETAGIELDGFAGGENAFHERAAGMDEGQPIADEALHDEAFAAEEAAADFFLEGDAELDAAGAAEEGVFLADHFAAELIEMKGNDLAGIGRSEGDGFAFAAGVGKRRHEDRLARQRSLAGAQHLVEEPLVLLAGVAKDGFHLDGGGHVHHGSGFRDDHFAGVERDFGVLHFAAEDFVVDDVAFFAGRLAGDADRLVDDFEASAGTLGLADEEDMAAGDAADVFAGELRAVSVFFAAGGADDVGQHRGKEVRDQKSEVR